MCSGCVGCIGFFIVMWCIVLFVVCTVLYCVLRLCWLFVLCCIVCSGYDGCFVLFALRWICVGCLYLVAVLFCSVCPGYATWMCWLYCSVVCVQGILRGCVGCIVL